MAVANQHAQDTQLVWQKHCCRLNVHQPPCLANNLSYYGARLKRPDHGVRRFQQCAQLAEFFQPVALETDERTCQIADLVVTRSEHGRIYRDCLLGGRQYLVLDGEGMEGTDDPDQQYEPEQQAADGEEQRRCQQPELQLEDNGQCLADRPLDDDSPASMRDGGSAEKPVLSIGSSTETRNHMALQRLVCARQLVQHRI